ncbi:MAG: hypothetical protein Q9215_003626 [Flavoplaca cf. flavocitrina]
MPKEFRRSKAGNGISSTLQLFLTLFIPSPSPSAPASPTHSSHPPKTSAPSQAPAPPRHHQPASTTDSTASAYPSRNRHAHVEHHRGSVASAYRFAAAGSRNRLQKKGLQPYTLVHLVQQHIVQAGCGEEEEDEMDTMLWMWPVGS